MKRKQRKVLSLLLSLAMLCSLAMPTAFAADSRYTDTPDHWAETAINRCSDYGIIEGYGDVFNPDNSITRGQMATILSKTLGLTEEAENPFSDISAHEWYAPYVLRCYKAGIMLGDNGKANPNAEITRQEAMTMFCRAFGIKAEETADLASFKDSGAIADWALPYVSALINGGIVSGVSSDMIAPADSMSRAALVTILDRAVVQYINTSGEYDLTDSNGIILVTAGDTILKGETKADILITQAADGKAVTFKDASVTGAVTVQADTKIINNNSKLPEIDATVEEVKKETPKKPSGGSSGGNYTPTISNLTINEEKAVTSGTYNNVTITDAVADGEVTLSNVTINGDLTIKGGGSSSIKLDACTIQGKVIMAKEAGEAPRLELTNTPVATVEVQKPAIIEAVDSASAVTKIEATANIEIKGENTKVDTLAVPETAESAVAVTVTAGNISTVEAKAETTVTGASNSVNTIIATAAVTADSDAVQKVEIPETATESVSVTVTGDATVDVEINSTSGAAVTGTNVTVSTTLETAPDNITVGGTAVTHIHKWGEPVTTPATCDQDGENVYTCIADGCDDVAETKTEVITKLGHKYGDWQKSDDDLHVRECANDKDHYEKQDHTWDEGKVTTEPTCEQEGIKTFTCSVCKGTKTEPIPENGHVWGEWVKADATSHKRVCKTNASHIDTEDHTPIIDPEIEATCTETGKTEGSHCDVCKSVIVEQTTTPALKHDFTGEYEKDADGHWHICERDNCEETDTKAGHTYNTTNCAEVATCTVCNYEKPAGEHTWSDWTKVDDTNHKRTCSCTATETAEHKWDDGKITTEPTETTEGVKTYTCSECKGTKTEAVPAIPEEDEPTSIYTFNEEKGLRIKWTEATLSEGQSYYVTIKEPSSQYNCTSASFPVGGFTSKDNVVSGKISITVDVGTGWKETSALYEEKEIANITVNSTVPQFTIEKDDNGAYNFVSDANGGLWVYQVYNEEGLLTYSGNAINGAIDSYANFESGCKVVARYMTWSLSDNKDYAEITLTQQAEYTYNESTASDVTITLVQDGDKIKATWTGTDSPNYYFMFADENGTLSGGWWVDGVCEIPDLVTFFPRVDTSSAYSFVLYAATEDYIKGEELARLENCFDITVSGEPMNYEMAFNTPEDGEHTITLGTAIPANVHHLGAWYRNNKLSSMDSGKSSYETAVGSTFTRNRSSIQDGDVYDLRLLTTYTLEGQTIKATMTPASKKTYVANNVEITLVQNGTSINATWTGANCDNGYTWALIEDGDIHQLDFVGKNVSTSTDFRPCLTRIDSGVHSYDFVLYEYDESAEDCIGKELGRLDNAIEVTITGEAVDYTMSFTAPADGQYQITLNAVPTEGNTYLTRWNRGKSNYSSIYVSDGTQTYTETTFMGALQDGDIYDLRLLTTYTLDGQTLKAVMTPPSKKTYTESASSDVEITLVQEGDSIKAAWTGTTAPNYYFEIEDSSGKSVTNGWTNGDECYTADLSLYLPRADADSNYTLVVYSANENWIVVEEIARLENCFEITVLGDTVEYDIVFNNGEDGVHSVTLTGDTLPSGIRLLDAWYDSLGKVRGSGSSSISKNKTSHHAIQNGYAYDLRVLTAYALDGQTIKATMTPPAKKTYINENEPKIKWSDGGAIAWQAVANADDYKLNIYSGNAVDSTKLVATKNIGTYSTVYYIDSNFDIAELADYKDTTFTIELLALDANDNVIEIVGVLAEGINLTFTETAPTYSFEVTGEKTYTITFAEGTPDGMRYIEWFDASNRSSGGRIGFGMTSLTDIFERAYAFAEGDTIKVYIATVDTITDTVWTITRTPNTIQTYTALEAE